MRTVFLCLAFVAGCGDASTATPEPGPSLPDHGGTGTPVMASGMAFVFGPSSAHASLAGASLGVAEAPALATALAQDGSFEIEVPSGGECSFTVHQPGFHDTQTAVLPVGAEGIRSVGFQVPPDGVYTLLASLIDAETDPTKCQIATTVSARGTAPYGGDALGVPGATVSLDPLGEAPLAPEHGPVYFDYLGKGVIVPARALTATTVDGGVLYVNVPPGDYVLSASKAGTSFTAANVRCRPGWLVNAAPPWGLQEL